MFGNSMHYSYLNDEKKNEETIINAYNSGISPSLMNRIPWIVDLTNTYPGNTFNEKLFHLIFHPENIKCLYCNKPTKFYEKNFIRGYAKFCNYSCRAKFNESYKNAHINKNKLSESLINYHKNRTREEKVYTSNKIKDTIQKLYPNNELGNKRSKSILGEEKYKILSDASYLNNEYYNKKRGIYNISNEIGVDGGTVKRFLNKNNIPIRNTKNIPYIETFIENFLIENNINYIKNDRTTINPLEIDFLCPDHNIGIEVCGLYWHSLDNKLVENRKDKNYHQKKFLLAKEKNIELLTIFEDEILNIPKLVNDRLLYRFNKNINKIYARKCVVVNITKNAAKGFMKTYHMQSSKTGSINIGLLYNNDLIAVASFNKPRYNNHYDLELLRFCTKNCCVVGGLSKLMNFMVDYKIISYSCNRWGNGSGYMKAGFRKIGITPPSYYYFKTNNPSKRYHRTQFQKHKIKTYETEHLTEVEIMKNNGYMRIFDCGNTKWEWSK